MGVVVDPGDGPVGMGWTEVPGEVVSCCPRPADAVSMTIVASKTLCLIVAGMITRPFLPNLVVISENDTITREAPVFRTEHRSCALLRFGHQVVALLLSSKLSRLQPNAGRNICVPHAECQSRIVYVLCHRQGQKEHRLSLSACTLELLALRNPALHTNWNRIQITEIAG
jgi:hypothetical protein